MSWFTAKGDQEHAFVAFSHDPGGTFGPPVRIDDVKSVGRVDVELLDDNSAVATWVEFSNQQSRFEARRIDEHGKRAPAAVVASSSGRRYPRLARFGNELI